jgi:DNA primase
MREHIIALVSQYLPGPFKASGSNIVCKCPFHKGGNETSPSFGINLEKGVFNCFSCHESGDIRRLLRLMGASRETIDAELKSIQPELDRARELHGKVQENFFREKDPFKTEYTLPEVILGVYDWMPTKLAEKGFDPALLQDMEIGFDRMNNRIMYPIRDMYGNLAGFSGGATLPEQFPKYKVYQGGSKKGSLWSPADFGSWFDEQHPGYRFENHHFLWNFNRVFPRAISMSEGADTVFIVEGFKACLWMIQAGFKNTVALMGSAISDRQQRMLHRLGGDIVLCLDNDDAGRKATERIGNLLWEPMFGRVFVMPYPEQHRFEKTQPDDYPFSVLHQLMQSAVPFVPKPSPRGQTKYSSEPKQWE